MKSEETDLFTVNVGSHMWMMNHANSDTDLFTCYISSSRKILSGEIKKYGTHLHVDKGRKIDVARHEVGAWVDRIIDNNVNYLWGVFSPIISYDRQFPLLILSDKHQQFEDTTYLTEFRKIATGSLSKQCFNSIMGLAVFNKKKYIDNPNENRLKDQQKRLNIIARTIKFGISILEGKGPIFAPARDTTISNIEELMQDLVDARDKSNLPEKAINEKEWREFLFDIRMKELNGCL